MRIVAVARVAEGQRDVGAILAHGLDRLGRLGLDVGDARRPGAARARSASSRGTTVGDADGNATSRTRPARRPRSSASSPAAASSAVVDRGRVTREHPARLGEAHAAADALDEGDAEALLEALELLADRRLAVAERLGRGR